MSLSFIAWTVLLAPLVSAATILLLTRRAATVSAGISIAACFVSFLGALQLFAAKTFSGTEWVWIKVGELDLAKIGLHVDGLSKPMLLVVTGIGLLIHIYSLGYMKTDAGKARFFAGLSL